MFAYFSCFSRSEDAGGQPRTLTLDDKPVGKAEWRAAERLMRKELVRANMEVDPEMKFSAYSKPSRKGLSLPDVLRMSGFYGSVHIRV